MMFTISDSNLNEFSDAAVFAHSEALDALTRTWVGTNNQLIPPPVRGSLVGQPVFLYMYNDTISNSGQGVHINSNPTDTDTTAQQRLRRGAREQHVLQRPLRDPDDLASVRQQKHQCACQRHGDEQHLLRFIAGRRQHPGPGWREPAPVQPVFQQRSEHPGHDQRRRLRRQREPDQCRPAIRERGGAQLRPGAHFARHRPGSQRDRAAAGG